MLLNVQENNGTVPATLTINEAVQYDALVATYS